MKNYFLFTKKIIGGILILGMLSILSCTTVVPPIPTCVGWEFNTNGESERWWTGQGITLEVLDGTLAGNITQSGSYGNFYKTLEIKYRIESPELDDITYFYWTNARDPRLGNDKRIKFDIQADNKWQIANVDLASSVNWKGVIKSVRLYPAWFSGAGTLVEFDYIRLCP